MEKTQKTTKGYSIPIPTKREFMENLAKLAKPKPRNSRPRRPKK